MSKLSWGDIKFFEQMWRESRLDYVKIRNDTPYKECLHLTCPISRCTKRASGD